MGMMFECRKRKASDEPAHETRLPKSARTLPDEAQIELSPSFMVTVATAFPPKRDGDQPEIIDVRVIGTFTHEDQARSSLLNILDADHRRLAYNKTRTSPRARGHSLAAQGPNTIHHSHDDVTGALCIVQHVVPSPVKPGTKAEKAWLRIGEIIPKEAMGVQRQVMSNSVYVVVGTEGDHYNDEMPVEGAEIVAVYRSQHEANRHVLSEFSRHGGPQKMRARPAQGKQEDFYGEEEDKREGKVAESNMLCFTNGRAKARVTGDMAVRTWEVVQKMYL